MKFGRAFLVGIACAAAQSPAAAQGRLVWDTLVSRSLQGNLLRDSPARSVIVYLPPSYDSAPARRYPVVYLLHGNRSHNTNFTNGTYNGFRIQTDLNSLIAAAAVRELIVVLPDAYNRYGGSHYTNSTVTGNWADFVAKELVAHVDRTYRTLATPQSRGLAGYSMGGRGVLALAMNYPGVFSAVYALSPGRLAFQVFDPFSEQDWRQTLALGRPRPPNVATLRVLSFTAAFSPNPKRPPFYVDLPVQLVRGKLVKVESTWRKWLANDPVALVPTHAQTLRALKGLRFDCGRSDALIEPNRLLAQTLREHHVPHVFEEYDGNHTSEIGNRLRARVFPFFSNVLRFD